MRRLVIIPFLLLTLALTGCYDITGVGRRGVEGTWSARIDGESVRFTLREDRAGDIRRSGYWGRDDIYITGERFSSELYLVFDFRGYSPIELEGRIRGSELEAWLYGSGFHGDRVVFRRGSRW